jgi:hypothetical protein
MTTTQITPPKRTTRVRTVVCTVVNDSNGGHYPHVCAAWDLISAAIDELDKAEQHDTNLTYEECSRLYEQRSKLYAISNEVWKPIGDLAERNIQAFEAWKKATGR